GEGEEPRARTTSHDHGDHVMGTDGDVPGHGSFSGKCWSKDNACRGTSPGASAASQRDSTVHAMAPPGLHLRLTFGAYHRDLALAAVGAEFDRPFGQGAATVDALRYRDGLLDDLL